MQVIMKDSRAITHISLDELKQKLIVKVARPPFDIVVTWVEGRALAIEDACNHAGASLAEGHLEGGCIVCPMHGYVFELASGKLRRPKGLCGDQRTYRTQVERDALTGIDRVAIYDDFKLIVR
jgi:nitrite reductase/ring-hydroxylating ferredoxin subunit